MAKVIIYNASEQESENVVFNYKTSKSALEETVTLKPGDSWEASEETTYIKDVQMVSSADKKPFLQDGREVVPSFETGWTPKLHPPS